MSDSAFSLCMNEGKCKQVNTVSNSESLTPNQKVFLLTTKYKKKNDGKFSFNRKRTTLGNYFCTRSKYAGKIDKWKT